MNWSNALTETEYFFIGLFVLFYALYLFRVFRIAKQIGSTPRSIVIKLFLRIVYFSLLIAAGLGLLFETQENTQTESQANVDVYFLVDLSKSMDSTNLMPNRLEFLKLSLLNYLEQKHSLRFGLVVFSDHAAIHCPLTLDYEAFKLFLKSLNTQLLEDIQPERNIESAFGMAMSKLKKSKHGKHVVVLSDSNVPFALSDSTRKILKTLDIVTHWTGTNSMPVDLTPEGKQYNLADKNLFKNVFQRIEQTTVFTNSKSGYQHRAYTSDKYYWVLCLALICLVIDILATVRVFKI